MKGTSDLSDDQIRAALTGVVNSGMEWPPTLPEFRKLATMSKPKYHYRYIALHKPISCPETALEAIKKMREILEPKRSSNKTHNQEVTQDGRRS